MHRNSFILLGVTVALVLSVALSATAAPTLEKPRTFSLLEIENSFVPLDEAEENRAPAPGDRFTSTSTVYRWTGANGKGARVGRDRVLLTFISGFGPKFTRRATVLVTAQVYLPDGSLLVEGFAGIPAGKPARIRVPVIGGTGVYDNARGYLIARNIPGGESRSKLDFYLVP